MALTAGELVRHTRTIARQLHQTQGFFHPPGNLLAGDTFHFQTIGDIVRNRHMREYGIGLEHHIDRALVGGHAFHILPIDQQLTFAGHFKARDHAQQRGLATAAGTQQGKEFPFLDVD